MKPAHFHRTNHNGLSPEVLTRIELEAKEAENRELVQTNEELEMKVQSLERAASLRSANAPVAIPEDLRHYIPNYYKAAGKQHKGQHGRALNRDTLQEVASVCATGLQYVKVELQRVLNGETIVPESTFYRNAKYCWWAAKEVFTDYQTKLVDQIVAAQKVPICVIF
jgi:hypothetical protein